MDYPRLPTTISKGPHLAGEIATTLAIASIVFEHDITYSKKLIKGDEALFALALVRDFAKRKLYNRGPPCIESYYNSTDYFDEYMWGVVWLYFATGNNNYLSLTTDPSICKINDKACNEIPYLKILSWNNKLPAAMLLLTRMMMFHNSGYPNEEMLTMY